MHGGSSDDNAHDMLSDQSGDSEKSVGGGEEEEGEPNDEHKIHDEDDDKSSAVAEDAALHDQGGEDGPCLMNPDVAEYILQSHKIIAAL